METTEKENATNEGINLQPDALTDLPVADERADETRGGYGGLTNVRVDLTVTDTMTGRAIINHNGTTVGGHVKVLDGSTNY